MVSCVVTTQCRWPSLVDSFPLPVVLRTVHVRVGDINVLWFDHCTGALRLAGGDPGIRLEWKHRLPQYAVNSASFAITWLVRRSMPNNCRYGRFRNVLHNIEEALKAFEIALLIFKVRWSSRSLRLDCWRRTSDEGGGCDEWVQANTLH